MIYASVCDGIGAAHVAWQPLGWRCAWTSEIDPFPMAVVDHHWGLPNLGDMTEITDDDLGRHGPVDLLVGGTPCQSFSVAGLRKGLADPRGNLALVYLGLAARMRPRWVVWENVPGVLSSGRGRDFGAFLGALGQLGYGFAYRVLDAQYVRVQSHPRAVPQRRRRVFVVGHLGDWRPAAAVLLEREGMCGHPAPRRVAGEGFAADAAPSLVASDRGVEGTGETRGQDPVVAIQGTLVGRTVGGPGGLGGSVDGTMYTLTKSDTHAVAFAQNTRDEVRMIGGDGQSVGALSASGGMKQTPYLAQSVAFKPCIGRNGRGYEVERSPALSMGGGVTSDTRPCVVQPYPVGNCVTRRMHEGINTTCDEGQTPIVASVDPYNAAEADTASSLGVNCGVSTGRNGARVGMVVRRLTPRECERLQGFPDDYTLVPYRGKPAKDGPRYRSLGNSMAVNVMSWIGQRIALSATVAASMSDNGACDSRVSG